MGERSRRALLRLAGRIGRGDRDVLGPAAKRAGPSAR